MPRTLGREEFDAIKARVLAQAPAGLSRDDFDRSVRPLFDGAIAEAENSPEPVQGGGVGRFASELYNKSAVPAVVGAVSGTANVVAHPLDTYFGLKPAAGTVVGLAKAQWDQAVKAAQKAKEAGRGGGVLSASEAFGHGLAAILPILGPAAADVGEHGARGDIAGMAGGATSLLAPFAVKYGLELKNDPGTPMFDRKTNAPKPREADLLRRDAEQTVSQRVLAPGNPKFKGTAEQIAPEVLSRGMQGSRLELQQLADEIMQKASDAIDAAHTSAGGPAVPVDAAPILARLDQRIADLSVNGDAIPTAAGKVKQLTALRDFIEKQGKTIPFDELRKMRDDFYAAADAAKGYQGPDVNMPDVGWAAREAGSAIREKFATDRPDVVGPNADYTFAKRLGDVLDPTIGRPKLVNGTPVGVTGGLATAGAVAGHALSGVPVVGPMIPLALARLMPAIQNTVNSPAWQLASAAKKMALADALEKGNVSKAGTILRLISTGAPRKNEGD